MSEGKSQKEQFLIQIDSIRKTLGIESMEDIQLLVDVFYDFGRKKKERLIREEEERKAAKEEQQSSGGVAPAKDAKDTKKNGEKGKQQPPPEPAAVDDEDQEEKDPYQPDIDLDDVVEVLEEFNIARENRLDNQDMVGN